MKEKRGVMDYIKKIYEGYKSVSVSCLEHELLLSNSELIRIKGDIRKALGERRCPEFISLALFNDLVDKYLVSGLSEQRGRVV